MRKPWREMTEDEKDRVRARMKRYRQRPEVKAKERMRKKQWKQKNKDKVRASERRRYMRTKANDDRMADRVARIATWREENRERYRKTMEKWRMLHPEYFSEWRTNRRLLFARDSKAYAAKREKAREYIRRKAEREGREYKPRMSIRIPDWCVFGQCEALARGSAFLRENMSDERREACDGYAMELALERRAWRG